MNICVLFAQLYSLLYHWKLTQLLLLFLWLISSFSHICLHLNLNPCLSVYSACTTTLAVFGSSTHFHIMVWSQSVSPCDWPHWMLSSWIFSSSWLRSARSWTAHHYNQRALTCSDFQEHFKNPQKNTGNTGNMAIVEIKGNRNKGFSVITLMSFCSQRHTCRNTSVGKTE